MKVIEIQSLKQKNGLWGIPMNCNDMCEFLIQDNRKEIIRSALITAIDEMYKLRFSIIFSCDNFFD